MFRARTLGLALSVVAGGVVATPFACAPPYANDGEADAAPADASMDARVDGSNPVDAAPADGGREAAVDASGDAPDIVVERVVGLGGTYSYNDTVCSVRDGGVQCAAVADLGQLGRGAPGAGVPTQISPVVDDAGNPITGVTSVSGGTQFECAQRGNQVVCWGANDYGQLAQGYVSSSGDPFYTPVAPPDGGSFIQVAVTTAGTCGLVDDGHVWCWGANGFGGLAQGPNADMSDTRTPKFAKTDDDTPLAQIVGIVGGDTVSCAVQSGGTVYCWGLGYGEFADGGNQELWATATPL